MIALKNVSKSFDGKSVLSDLNLNIKKSGVTCLMGASGSGKTTLLRILARLSECDSGTICGLNGEKLSVVFQEDRLIPYSDVLSNVTFTGAEKETALSLIGALGLSGEEHSKIDSLSGGMKRRVALARALACPSYTLLLLDEPFTGLDSETKGKVMAVLNKELKGKTAVIATHSPEDAVMLSADVINLNA